MGITRPGKLLTIFCCERPFIVERLMTSIKAKIQESKIKEQKMQYFMLYCLVIEQIFDFLKRELSSGEVDVKSVLVKNVTFYLCHLIGHENYEEVCLNLAASEFLEKFLNVLLPVAVDSFKSYLNHVTSTLISVCKKSKFSGNLEEKCLKILKFLTIDGKGLMKEEIAQLDSFPNEEKFQRLRENHLKIKYGGREFSLVEEIEHFLAIETRNIEGLICLRENVSFVPAFSGFISNLFPLFSHQLSSKKKDLCEMFVDLSKMSQLTEETEKSLLHKLIRALLKHVSGSDQDKSIEAVRCLGEIGAYDLTRMVFNCEDIQNCTTYNEINSLEGCMAYAFEIAITELLSLVLRPEKEVFTSSALALRQLMCSESLRKLLNVKNSKFNLLYNDVALYMHKTNADITIFSKPDELTNFLAFLNQQENIKYSSWIKNFCNLTLGYLKNSFLQDVVTNVMIFAKKMLPILFQILLSFNDKAINDDLLKFLNQFFERHDSIQKSMVESIFLNKFAIKMMLDIAECLRVFQMENLKFQTSTVMNYLMIAKAARFCQAEFTAVLYCELWAQHKLDKENVAFSSSFSNRDLQETMHEVSPGIFEIFLI